VNKTSAGQHTLADAREFAGRYLAMREHSCKEIRDKLSRKGVSSSVISEAIEELQDKDLLSDQRFAESFTRSRISRLQGPLKIRAELMKRGVASALIDQTLHAHSEDWAEAALRWVEKKCKRELDRDEKGRLYRTGTNRGFTHEQMFQAFDAFLAQDG
jgi:regulatory protein